MKAKQYCHPAKTLDLWIHIMKKILCLTVAFALSACQQETEPPTQTASQPIVASAALPAIGASQASKTKPQPFSEQRYFEQDITDISQLDYGKQVKLFHYITDQRTKMRGEHYAQFSRMLLENHSYAWTVQGYEYFARNDGINAEKWLLPPAEQGNAYAQDRLGELYLLGMRGIKPNREKAMYWFERSAENNYAFAAFVLGAMYADIQFKHCELAGIEDAERRKRIIERSKCNMFIHEYNDDISGFYVPNINQLGANADLEKARYWFERSAQLNYPPASRILIKFQNRLQPNHQNNKEDKAVQPDKKTNNNAIGELF